MSEDRGQKTDVRKQQTDDRLETNSGIGEFFR
jgi:hypothetical protein